MYDSKRLTQAIKAGLTPEILRRLATEEGVAFDGRLGRGQTFTLPTRDSPLAADMRFVEMSAGAPRFLDATMAMDVQSELVTVSNAGIPFFLANWLDPKGIPILVSPRMGAHMGGGGRK